MRNSEQLSVIWILLSAMCIYGGMEAASRHLGDWRPQFPFQGQTGIASLPDAEPLAGELDDTEAVCIDTLEPGLVQPSDSRVVRTERAAEIRGLVQYSGLEHISGFLGKLAGLKQSGKKVRIAFFGDSMIEGDLITQHFRDSMQSRYGGAGIGWLPIYSQTAALRMSVHQQTKGDFKQGLTGRDDPASFPYGISGEWLVTGGTDKTLSCSYRSSSHFEHAAVFPSVDLYYKVAGNPVRGKLLFRSGKVTDTIELATDDRRVQRLSITGNENRAFDLSFLLPDSAVLYGLDASTDTGLIVDNFPSRGNSGLTFTSIRCSDLMRFQQLMQYDLLILSFGLNVVSDKKSFNWYAKGMTRVLNHLKKCMPQTEILLVSLPDKGAKIGTEMGTHPSVPKIRQAQETAARNSGVAFFDLYAAMGGEGSMVKWQAADPPLAKKDFSHFTAAGSEKAAGLLIEFLLAESGMEIESVDENAMSLNE